MPGDGGLSDDSSALLKDIAVSLHYSTMVFILVLESMLLNDSQYANMLCLLPQREFLIETNQ